MLNGTTGAAAVCCEYAPGQVDGGVRGTLPGGSIGGQGTTPGGLLERVGAALDRAIHGGDASSASGPSLSQYAPGAVSRWRQGGNIVQFPMVNPFKPIVKTGSPVTALTAWPKRFTYEVPPDPAGTPDDEQGGLSGLGDAALGAAWDEFDPGYPSYSLPSSPSKLQTVLGTIQATLPATIQALRAQPANIYPGQVYNPYASNAGGYYPGQQRNGAGADIGASAGAAVGNVGDTVSGIVARHPFLVMGGGLALLLLFMNPPRRR